MPAGRTELSVHPYDVLGIDSETERHFPRHLCLVDPGDEESADIQIVHMGPPLDQEPLLAPIGSWGSVPLSRDEIRQISLFVERLKDEYDSANLSGSARQYCIAPHVSPARDRDGTVIFRRYSCAGFVLEAYAFAGVALLETDAASLPSVGLDLLKQQYPAFASTLDRPSIRERMGLVGDGPWPVVLCGYVLNALDRTEGEIRAGAYTAKPGDEYFPSRAGSFVPR